MIAVLNNEITLDGMRRIRVMSDMPLTEGWMRGYVPGAARGWERITLMNTAALSLFYGEVVYPCREVVDGRVGCIEGRLRRLAVWRFIPEEKYRVSEVIEFLGEWYFRQTHRQAGFAFMRRLPRDAENGMEMGGIMLLEADWALEKCVMIGG